MQNSNIKVFISTLGCKVNQCDSAAMAESLKNSGYEISSSADQADICIVNTCVVTHKTEAQSRQQIRKCLKSSSGGRVIAAGCYAQKSAADLENISERVMVLGNREKRDIVRYVNLFLTTGKAQRCVGDIMLEKRFSTPANPAFMDRTRAFLKVQDGCNARCAYCIVPRVRGKSRSLSPEAFVSRIHAFADQGFKEVVLTGIHLGAYGLDLVPQTSLLAVLEKLESDDGLSGMRIRISSFEPKEFSNDLIDFISRSERICPHLHISLQSGDAEILKRMRRPYTPGFFKDLCRKLSAKLPDINIGIDVIAGFPGETENCFANTYDLITGLPCTYLHVFPYSRREGTVAAELDGQVPDDVKKKRVQKLIALSSQKKAAYYSRYLDREVAVLVEGKRDKHSGMLRGFSRNYIPVLFEGGDSLMGTEVPVHISRVGGGVAGGELRR